MKRILTISIAIFIVISSFRFLDKIGPDPRELKMKWPIYAKVESSIISTLNHPSTY
tara:strand:+ start:802 stop:969 length:168 start_codon:yes stop_codon:yes gene_type:complete